jgi:hypothetical protein
MKLSLASTCALALAALFCGGLSANPASFRGYSFDAQVVQGNGLRYRTFMEGGQPFLKVRPNEEYSIVVYNPLPVRVGVAVTIDGLNSIDGKRSSPRRARKWMIDPHGSITIEGWQTGSQTLRKFVFTQDENSYAQWKEKRDQKDYSRNIGVIGVAWFWNAEELERALHPPKPFDDETTYNKMMKKSRIGGGDAAPSAAPSRAEDRAGTGMGRQEMNHVTEVEFNPTAGMYSNNDVLKIFYEFAKEPAQPQPFVSDEEEDGRFAPEMK